MANVLNDIVHRYQLFGMSILSAIELPELYPLNTSDGPAITVEPGNVPIPQGIDAESSGLVVVSDVATLIVPDVARFAIVGGNRIVFDAVPGVAPISLRLFLLGSAMGILLHQRGIVPLHANAIDIGKGAIAFLGPSGAGKSTLAAAFHDRGLPILSDDVCALECRAGDYFALPGVPRLRLWRDALENSGRNPSDCERVLASVDKFTVPTDQAVVARPTRLRAIFVLARNDMEGIAIRELSGLGAFQAVLENIYRGAALERIGEPQAYFEICLSLIRRVPVFEFSRPWDATGIDHAVVAIERTLAGLPSAATAA